MTQIDLLEDGYPAGFFKWLSENRDLYNAFCAKALQMARYRKHYSARAILHAIRWETDLREKDSQFKCNNSYTPGMARLFMKEYPQHKGFFMCRNSQGLDE